MANEHYYFATHVMKKDIYSRLAAGDEVRKLDSETQEIIESLVKGFDYKPKGQNPTHYCQDFVKSRPDEFDELLQEKGYDLYELLVDYIGFVKQWGSSTRSFGTNSNKTAGLISESDLVEEMTNPKRKLKKLLDSAGGDLKAVKPFLPALMISLKTNTRDKHKMVYKHSGIFSFDFDKFESTDRARKALNKVWAGTKNLKPYMGFISPSGKGVKVFFKVNVSEPEFVKDFSKEEKDLVTKNHKEWYEGARKELISTYPDLGDNLDIQTNDPQRLTYIPFISDKSKNFKYDPKFYSNYADVISEERQRIRAKVLKEIKENSTAIANIMKKHNISSKEDAYQLMKRTKSTPFDLEYETEKFIAVVDELERLSSVDIRISNWVSTNFSDYNTLQSLSYPLYAVFGDLAIEQLKRLVPEDSNKLDENHTDYRWSLRSQEDYTEEQRKSCHVGGFYSLIMSCGGEMVDFVKSNYSLGSKNVTDFKLINSYYESYQRNLDLYEADNEKADLDEFLDKVTDYIDKKKIRLPLIKELDTIAPDVKLGPKDYLDKKVMEHLFQVKYSDKKIFSLRSQCGTGKNSIAGHPEFKIPGRTILAEPFKGISNQMAKEAWDEENRPDQLFVNSTIEDTVRSFKTSDTETLKVNYESSLRGIELPNSKELVVHCTYNQVCNLTHDQLTTIDYLYIDEAHTLADGLNYRADTISNLIYHLIEFVARVKCKTKIIFMSGTPNSETHVIPEIMEEYGIGKLFQRIIIEKEYEEEPTLHLTHLDTVDVQEREDAIINQINRYLKQGRKVCHIYNNKAKMNEVIRTIQTKLTSSIKVGMFSSESTGTCTQNIFSGKFGEYDVVLATTYFINGININRDGLSEQDVLDGKTSTQKYGVVIDLGGRYTRVNSMDAIQAINRFRNRLVHSTVFLPKIFKPDLLRNDRKFDFGNAGRVLLGLNKYNFHLLSTKEELSETPYEGLEHKARVHLLDVVRKNPLHLSFENLKNKEVEENNKFQVIEKIDSKSKIYEDWLCSLDGYHYLAKDAGFTSIIRHKSLGGALKTVDTDQVELENTIIRNFLDDEDSMYYLYNQIDPEKRFLVKSTDVIVDPSSTSVSNFSAENLLNDKYVITGDFHTSHERTLNHLIRSHLRLAYWYDQDTSISLLRYLINPEIDILPKNSSSYLKNIITYVNACKVTQLYQLDKGLTYLRALDSLSSRNLGIKKVVDKTYVTYTILDPSLSPLLRRSFADQQYQMIIDKIDNSESLEKEELRNYYSNKELIREYDLEDLDSQLGKLGIFNPVKYSLKGNLKNVESIVIPRVLSTNNLLGKLDIDIEEYAPPLNVSLIEEARSYDFLVNNIKKSIKKLFPPKLIATDPVINQVYKGLNTKIAKKDIQMIKDYIQFLEDDPSNEGHPLLFPLLKSLKKQVMDLKPLFLVSFQASERLNYRDYKLHGYSTYVHQNFICDKSFKLESLNDSLKITPNTLTDKDIYESLWLCSDTYVKASSRRLKKRIYSGSMDPTKEAYIVTDKSNTILHSSFSKSKAIQFLCDYAFKNQRFILEDGSTPMKKLNKGIYNPKTFKRNYLENSSKSRTVSNYKIKYKEIEILEYKKYIESL